MSKIAAGLGRAFGAGCAVLHFPAPRYESAFWTAWNRADCREGYLNRRKRRWLRERLLN